MFQACLNLTMRKKNGVDEVILVSLLLTSDILARASAVSTSDNDCQAKAVGEDIDPMVSLRPN